MKQAKIAITADIRGFKAQVEAAKKTVDGLTKMKMSPELSNSFKKIFGEQLTGQIKNAEKAAAALQKRIEAMGKSGVFAPKALESHLSSLDAVNKKLDEMKKKRKDIESIGSGKGPSVPGGGGGGDEPGGAGGGLLGKFSGIAKAAGLALGAMYIYQRRLKMAQDRTAIRETGSALGTETSQLGFTPEERRQRMLETSKASGRNLGSHEMTDLTDLGETVQRAYGIDQSQSTGAMKTARTNNEQGDKYLGQTIGAAVAAKLEGSRIGEFLQASSSALEEMNHNGIGIDSASLNGFAGALSTLPFFKNDPAKAFEAIKGMADMFQHGDRFQQAQSAGAIQKAGGGGLSPAAIELRRDAGLFTKPLGAEDAAIMQKVAPDVAKAFSIGGGTIVKNLVSDAVKQTQGEGGAAQIYDVKQRLGLQGASGTLMAARLINSGGDMSKAGIKDEEFKNAQMDPTERLAKTMENADGHMIQLNATLQQSLDKAVDGLTNTIIELTTEIRKLIEKFGGREASSNIGGAVIGIGTAIVGGSILKNFAKKIFGRGAAAAGEGGAAAAEGVAGAEGAALGAEGAGAAGAAGGIGVMGGLAVAGAGLAGYGVGMGINKFAIDPLTQKYGEKNRYGQSSNFMERGVGKAATMLPSWAGGITDDQYDSMYGTSGSDPMVENSIYDSSKKGAGKGIGPGAMLDTNTKSTDANTAAIEALTTAIAFLQGRGGNGPMMPGGMKIGGGDSLG